MTLSTKAFEVKKLKPIFNYIRTSHKSTTKMDNIIIPGEFNAKKISFLTPRVLDNGGKVIYISYAGKPLIFQTPEMIAPFGMGKWANEGRANDKYTLDLSFKGKETREHLQYFFDGLQELDKTLVKAGLDNSQAWFKKKYSSLDVVEALYTPTVKYAKDKATGENTDKYPPTFKINLPYRDGQFECEVYDRNRNIVDLNGIETKGAKVSAIIRCTGIWIAGSKYGCSFKVLQMRISPPSTIKGYAFKEIDDKVDDDIDEEEAGVTQNVDPNEIFEGAAPNEKEKEELIESSEEESEDELEAKPEPVVPKKKVVTKK